MYLAPLAIGQQAYVMACCPSSIHLFVCPLTFIVNILFSKTTYPILMKFHRNVSAMILFRILERISFLQKLLLPWQQNLEKMKFLKNPLVRN